MITNWMQKRWFKPAALLLFIAALWAAYAVYPQPPAEVNAYILQAQSFLHGRISIPIYVHDAAIFNGRYYVIHPPFPAALLVPFVALGGPLDAEILCLSLALALATRWLAWRFYRRLGCELERCLWLCAAFFFGTGYWFAAAFCEGVWYFAHLVAVACLFGALHESLSRGRGWLAGLLLGCAFLSRQLSLYAGVFLAAALWCNPRHAGRTLPRLGHLVGLAAGFGLCFALYLFYNWARFGDMFDTGYDYLALTSFLKTRVERLGQFHWAYVPFNFTHLFLQGFHLEYVGADLMYLKGMDRFGTSITFASPFVFFAFRAREKPLFLLGAAASIAIALIHQLFYYNNGFLQYNAQRFALDVLPIVMVLLALGARRISDAWLKAAIAYAVVLNILALFLVPGLKWFQDVVLRAHIRIG